MVWTRLKIEKDLPDMIFINFNDQSFPKNNVFDWTVCIHSFYFKIKRIDGKTVPAPVQDEQFKQRCLNL